MLRCMGIRWLTIIIAMIHNSTPYNAVVFMHNQLQHPSWVMWLEHVQIIKKDAR